MSRSALNNSAQDEFPLGLEMRHITREQKVPICQIAWSPDGQTLASASLDDTIRLWSVETGQLYRTLKGHSGYVISIAWSPNGQMLASGSSDKTIYIWDLKTRQPRWALKEYSGDVVSIAKSPDRRIPASESLDEATRIWNLGAIQPRRARTEAADWLLNTRIAQLRRTIEWYYGSASNMISLPEEPISNSESHRLTARPWEPTIAQVHRISEVYSGPVYSLAWSPDCQIIAWGSSEAAILLWDLESQQLRWPLEGQSGLVLSLAWSPKGRRLASGTRDNVIQLWDPERGELIRPLEGHSGPVTSVVWSPDGQILASSSYDRTIRVWDPETERQPDRLEGHTDRIDCISFSSDGRLLASKSRDGTVQLWRRDTWERVAVLDEPASSYGSSGVCFHPNANVLATLGAYGRAIRVWDLAPTTLLDIVPQVETVRYTSAKIVLVGESNVGKSCLAMRLSENRFPKDGLGTTHGMLFWQMEAEKLHRSAKPPEGERRDIVLWDFGGQDEYQLVHQMFLHNTTLVLILIDPTRGRVAVDEARDWNKRLEKHFGERRVVKLLVGAKQDRKSQLVNRVAIDELCRECGFAGYYETSARTGRRIKTLRRAIAKALDWDNLAKTSRPELFQCIRDDIEERRESGEVVLLLEELKDAIKKAHPKIYEEAAVEAVSEQLATQGVIAQTKLTSGEDAVVLQLPVIERYACSLIVAARDNPRGVPALEERLLGSPDISLPGMAKKERLRRLQERIVLECIAELMIQHGICFRHESLLVFPTLFPEEDGDDGERIPHSVSLYYDFTGAIDNIYASLVARLMISQKLGEGRLWPGRVEFDQPGQSVCGIRQIRRTGGLAHVDLFFAEDTEEDCRNLFTRFVEDHLRRHGVEIREHQIIKCRGCGEEIAEDIVQANIAAGQKDVICPWCRTHTLISEGVAKIRERDPELDQRIFAIKSVVDHRMVEDAQKAKRAVTSGGKAIARTDEPIRLLHLSDLHFTDDTSPRTKCQWLLQDIRKGECLGFDTVEYLVISGDMTNKGSEEGLEKAREFVSLLNDALGVSAERCIFVPGNHDVQDMEEAYDWYSSEARARKADPDETLWHREGNVVFVPSKDQYPNRFKRFSNAFFHKIIQKPYPLDCAQQGIAYLFPGTQIQFLALNSCWQIDHFHRKRSGLHPDAVAHVIEEAEKQVQDAIDRGEMKKGQKVLRFCVWHHSVQHPKTMQNADAIENLQNADVRICLHGDVHEMNRDMFKYWHPKRVDVVGAGSFGSPAEGRPESMPRLYNLLEVKRDLSSVRVHTRRQEKPDGSWNGWYEWDDPDGGKGHVPYYDIDLS